MKTRILVLLICVLASIGSTQLAKAEDVPLTPMNVKLFEILQRQENNDSWSGVAYRNYLIGLFEGLLFSEGSETYTTGTKLFCLPAQFRAGSVPDVFSRLEVELKVAVRGGKPEEYVSQVFIRHLVRSFPCR
jgi:hypothetical protein